MILRQSTIKTFSECALKYRFEHVDKAPREQSSALTWGSVMHESILRLETWHDHMSAADALAAAQQWFKEAWADPAAIDPEYAIDYMMPRTSWKKYLDEGLKILEKWWGIYQWDTDVVLAREYQFTVPVEGTDHHLTGTIDRLALRYVARLDENAVLIQDYKSSRKVPTYQYLQHDLQFTAYSYATTRPEFWVGLPNGENLYKQLQGNPRMGEWVHLRAPKRMDAGERTDMHYARLRYAVNAVADSIALGVFVPNIGGESCAFCDFRKSCGLPTLEEEGYYDRVNPRPITVT